MQEEQHERERPTDSSGEGGERPSDVKAIYVVPRDAPKVDVGLSFYLKIYPIPWWKKFWPWRPKFRGWWQSACHCCCCCAAAPPPVAMPAPAVPIPQAPAPAITLTHGTLPIGGAFYLLITPFGSVAEFVVQWASAGGVGQLTVDLDVQDPAGAAYRRLVSGRGPADQYTYTNAVRGRTYLFRATVADSRGQSSFATLSVVVPKERCTVERSRPDRSRRRTTPAPAPAAPPRGRRTDQPSRGRWTRSSSRPRSGSTWG